MKKNDLLKLFIYTYLILGNYSVHASLRVEEGEFAVSQQMLPKLEPLVVKLSSTKILCDELAKDISYYWQVPLRSIVLESFSAREHAENTPFINLVQLLNEPTHPYKTQNHSLAFDEQDTNRLLDAYFQGKLQLSWIYNGLKFHQYCAHSKDPFHTLSVTPYNKNVTYYRQQRYTNEHFNQIGDVFFDTRYQVEYWYEPEIYSWVTNDIYKGEIAHPTRREGLKYLKELGPIDDADETYTFFLDPYSRSIKNALRREFQEEKSPSFGKMALLGSLFLVSNITDSIFNNNLVKPLSSKAYPNNELLYNSAVGQSTFQKYNLPVIDLVVTSPSYSIIVPLLASSLLNRDGRVGLPYLLSAAALILPKVQSMPQEDGYKQEIACKNEVCTSVKEAEKYQAISGEVLHRYADLALMEHDTLPLSEGYIEYGENKQLVQIVAKKKFINQSASKIAEIVTTIQHLCGKHLEKVTWKHDDEKKQSYVVYDVYATRDNEKRKLLGHQEIAEFPEPHRLIDKYFQSMGEPLLKEDIPYKQYGKICKQYERPDQTTYTIVDTENHYDLLLEHVNFSHDLSNQESYQVVKMSVRRGTEHYTVYNEYTLTRRKFSHKHKFLRWFDDKLKHKSFKIDEIYIEPEMEGGAINSGNIPTTHKIVRKEHEELVEEHKEIWWWWLTYYLPGANYEITRTGEKY